MFTPITRTNFGTLNSLRRLVEYLKAIALRKLRSRGPITSRRARTSGMGSIHLQPWSRQSDDCCMSLNRDTVPQQSKLFTDLLTAVQSDNPESQLAALLQEHEGQPYFSDLQAKAKTLLFVRSQGKK